MGLISRVSSRTYSFLEMAHHKKMTPHKISRKNDNFFTKHFSAINFLKTTQTTITLLCFSCSINYAHSHPSPQFYNQQMQPINPQQVQQQQHNTQYNQHIQNRQVRQNSQP